MLPVVDGGHEVKVVNCETQTERTLMPHTPCKTTNAYTFNRQESSSQKEELSSQKESLSSLEEESSSSSQELLSSPQEESLLLQEEESLLSPQEELLSSPQVIQLPGGRDAPLLGNSHWKVNSLQLPMVCYIGFDQIRHLYYTLHRTRGEDYLMKHTLGFMGHTRGQLKFTLHFQTTIGGLR